MRLININNKKNGGENVKKLNKKMMSSLVLSIILLIQLLTYNVIALDNDVIIDTELMLEETLIVDGEMEFSDETTEVEADELMPMAAADCGLPTGGAITGWTDHGAKSAYSHDGHGVSDAAILMAMNASPVWNAGNSSWNYIGPTATVCLNTAGKVTTCWPTSSAGWRY